MDNDKNEFYTNVIWIRTIFSIFSLICCIIIIFLYLILCFQVILHKYFKNRKNNDYLIESRSDKEEEAMSQNIIGRSKIGLGSHFILMLIISNFFLSILAIIFSSAYKGKNPIEEKNDATCITISFFHTFFEISSVCWTTLITRLFLKSTENSELSKIQEKHELQIGFIYSFFFSFILSVFPLFSGSYGNAFYQCSFNYQEITAFTYIWMILINIFGGLNFIYNLYSFWKVNQFYSEKLDLLQSQQRNSEYKLLRHYVWAFRVFPFILIVTRLLNVISRILDIQYYKAEEQLAAQGIIKFFVYLSSTAYCLNGFFNSAFCSYFFRGVFNMCKKKKDNDLSLNSQVEDLKERISIFPESESDLNVSQEDADVKYD